MSVEQYIPDGVAPEEELEMPLPTKQGASMQTVAFFRAVGSDGESLADWLQSQRSTGLGAPANWRGVYMILGLDDRDLYIGSSAGTTPDGQMRRTINRHLQQWFRRDSTRYPGYVVDRREVAIAAFPTPARTDPRLIETYLIETLTPYGEETGLFQVVNKTTPTPRTLFAEADDSDEEDEDFDF